MNVKTSLIPASLKVVGMLFALKIPGGTLSATIQFYLNCTHTFLLPTTRSVSYTHLDVYKRQDQDNIDFILPLVCVS